MRQFHSEVATDAVKEPSETRAERREQQVQRILQSATECFVRSGFHGASMQDICRGADMSPGALYRYFPSKESLVEAIVDGARERDVALLGEMSREPNVVEGIVRAFFNHRSEIQRSGLRPLFLEVRAEATRNEGVRCACHASLREVAKIFDGYLSAAKAEGRIDPIMSLGAVIEVLLATGEGLIMADLDEKDVDDRQIECLLRATVTAALRPIPATGGQSA